jgi:cytochrome c oxidase cbb3-type subunit I/II
MTRYSWLLTQKLDTNSLPSRIRALRRIGVPYPEGYEAAAPKEMAAQQAKIVQGLKVGMINAQPDREIIALIAYLQRLGTDIKGSDASTAPKVATN